MPRIWGGGGLVENSPDGCQMETNKYQRSTQESSRKSHRKGINRKPTGEARKRACLCDNALRWEFGNSIFQLQALSWCSQKHKCQGRSRGYGVSTGMVCMDRIGGKLPQLLHLLQPYVVSLALICLDVATWCAPSSLSFHWALRVLLPHV